MQAAVRYTQALPDAAALCRLSHVLCVLESVAALSALPAVHAPLAAFAARRRLKGEAWAKEARSFNLESGTLVSVVVVDPAKSAFEQLAALREAAAPLLAEQPDTIALCVSAQEAAEKLAAQALYVLLTNGAPLPAHKTGAAPVALKSVRVFGVGASAGFEAVQALAAGNTLARALSTEPPNALDPKNYRKRIRALAKTQGWGIEEFDLKKLRAMGAGAFVAVAQGSVDDGAALVHLRYAPRGAKHSLALVGKGICFDTGGHNLKPAKYMAGMHEDMNGSAVVLGLLHAASVRALPLRIDAWLAIAQNHISRQAYKQNDIVTALDGTTIEVVHTDAEGRMVLCDALALAGRAQPDLMIDFATLTGAMITALGTRYSGVFAQGEGLGALAVAAGQASGERVNLFPLDADYDKALESKVADIKQCTLEGEADHILAARFLRRFVGDRPWLHVDLSAAVCAGGLGGIATDTTGFGVVWGMALIEAWLAQAAPVSSRSRSARNSSR